MTRSRTSSRFGRVIAVSASAVMCAALVACGPADGGSGGLQALSSSAAATAAPASATPSITAPSSTTQTSASPAITTPTITTPTTTAPPAPVASSIDVSVGKESVRYGDQAAFQISVHAPQAVPGTDMTAHVTVLDGATVIVEGDTDTGGNTTLDFINTADPGPKAYTVTWSGTALVMASTAEISVPSTQTDVDIAIDWPDNVKPGDSPTITADVIGTPQSPTGTATISYNGTQIAAGPIDANGKISGSVSAIPAGDHIIQVSYAGDVRFQPDTASATLTVKEPVVNPNQAGADAAQANNPCPVAAAACIDLANTQAWLQSGGQITYGPVPITSGMAGYRTRTGMFEVFYKNKNHKSSLFNDAPMPNSVFFDGDIAFHQGSLYDQSHGCIHLSWDASATFFDALGYGAKVYAWGAPPY
jgi:hypothetical protein